MILALSELSGAAASSGLVNWHSFYRPKYLLQNHGRHGVSLPILISISSILPTVWDLTEDDTNSVYLPRYAKVCMLLHRDSRNRSR